MQLICCGARICAACGISKLQQLSQCPFCEESGIPEARDDKGFRRELEGLSINCPRCNDQSFRLFKDLPTHLNDNHCDLECESCDEKFIFPQQITKHQQETCRKRIVCCPLDFVGCSKEVRYDEMVQHYLNNQHQRCLMLFIKRVFPKSFQGQAMSILPPFFDEHNGQVVQSEPIQTSQSGYKLAISCGIFVDEQNKKRYVSISFIILPGEFDPILSWPFRFPVTIKYVNSFSIEDLRSSFDNKYNKENNESNDCHPLHNDVILDVYNCDLTMIVKHDCLRGKSMIDNGLCSLWSGVRVTYGINQRRGAFQIKILHHLHSSDLLHNGIPYGIRVDWLTNESDESLSYGYEETGYLVDDIITCYANFESECGNILLSFAKNDLNIELEYRINYEDIHSGRLFSHIFIKNLSFQINFGQLNTKYFLQSNFRLINDYDEDERTRGRLDPSSKQECENNNCDCYYKIIDRATKCLKIMFDLASSQK
ncbi:unnamed protein product [Rotaria sordida]|uniref:TRAF1-6 MATH domain-containing protein n=1 Tax=Rotaria sordida TaxID=392033 RepID=A0A814Y9B6_9BILA|nr:unnamed protein product [Rotaria sordida]